MSDVHIYVYVSVYQQLQCIGDRGHSFHEIFMKFGQIICLGEIYVGNCMWLGDSLLSLDVQPPSCLRPRMDAWFNISRVWTIEILLDLYEILS